MNLVRKSISLSLRVMGNRRLKKKKVSSLQELNRDEFVDIADLDLYRPTYSPWLGKGDFRKYYELAIPRTLVSVDRCYVLYSLCRQAVHLFGDFWECGVYKGGTAAMLAQILKDSQSGRKLWLFDTFEGMPVTDPEKDWHNEGDFSDTSLDSVLSSIPAVESCVFRKGNIPETFVGLEDSKISFAHVDVDIYKSVMDSAAFIWPRLVTGGFMVFDDYGFKTCFGARQAVDEFFKEKKVVPLCLPTGQAVVFKSKD